MCVYIAIVSIVCMLYLYNCVMSRRSEPDSDATDTVALMTIIIIIMSYHRVIFYVCVSVYATQFNIYCSAALLY